MSRREEAEQMPMAKAIQGWLKVSLVSPTALARYLNACSLINT